MNFVPEATSSAGLCLTMGNWSEVGVTALAFSLESLLIKPGVSVLKAIADIRAYLGWSGVFILNAGQINRNKEGNYTTISPFDGSRCTLSCSDLVALIVHLKPDLAILPQGILGHMPQFWADWDESIMPYFYEDDLQVRVMPPHGIYFNLDEVQGHEQLMHYLKGPVQQTCYVAGNISLDVMKQLQAREVQWIQSNQPAQEALQGRVYSQTGLLDLMDNRYEQVFERIDPHCLCPTCSHQLTQAYLHHLLIHTPLLCQRFLIMHAVCGLQKMGQISKKNSNQLLGSVDNGSPSRARNGSYSGRDPYL